MKLLNKLSLRYLIFSLLILVMMGCVTYFVLSYVIREEMDEKLKSSLNRIVYDIDKHDHFYTLEPFTNIDRVKKQKTYLKYSDTKVSVSKSRKQEDFRQLTTVKKINGKYYKIIIRESKLESKDLLQSLAVITLLGFIILIVCLIIINRQITKSIWAPFYKNLALAQNFSLHKQTPLDVNLSDIHEFNELNKVLSDLTDKAIKDYQNLKQFSEDASHEIQTPLAIIKSKIESLLDNNNFDEAQSESLNSIHRSIHRLSKLNKDLVLLTKIENKQFDDQQEINFRKIIEQKLEEFKELISLKGITLTSSFNSDIKLKMSPIVAEILINNFISNGIKHNTKKGILSIETTENYIIFSNSGKSAIKHPDLIFNRFYKEDSSSGSVGLGLAISRKICENNNIKYEYSYGDKLHCFKLIFNL